MLFLYEKETKQIMNMAAKQIAAILYGFRLCEIQEIFRMAEEHLFVTAKVSDGTEKSGRRMGKEDFAQKE